MWAEAAKALATFPGAVVTAVDADGYPTSIRQAATHYDANTGEMRLDWPPGFAITEGPATVLCHFHDEQLWNIRTVQIKGRLERRTDGWVFISTAFAPPAGVLLSFWRFATRGRATGRRYLNKRSLQTPPVNWDSIHELRRRADSDRR